MPRRSDTKKTKKEMKYQPRWLEWKEQDKQEIIRWSEDRDIDLASKLEEWTEDGWKISLSYSDGWGAFVASLSTVKIEPYNDGSVYMFKHQQCSRAIGFINYFLGVMVENGDARLSGKDEADNW